MAFNLKKVLKALLFSSSQPLATKDIQAAFTRFHEQALLPVPTGAAEGAVGSPAPEEAAEIPTEMAADDELYREVPSLVTASQIREAMDEIAAELRARDEGILLIEGSAGYRL
ncbi:MAG TPA: SMC-Scp complex subunit ScpB, partial [Opitutaceae bacterium]|nr:SMC-Scp complex subunit ScpB [Opitutaceae bacterium]